MSIQLRFEIASVRLTAEATKSKVHVLLKGEKSEKDQWIELLDKGDSDKGDSDKHSANDVAKNAAKAIHDVLNSGGSALAVITVGDSNHYILQYPAAGRR